MKWKKLLQKTRFTIDKDTAAIPPKKSGITVFQEDAERIVYSLPFRRMQGKTQVHPLPVDDYLRTRLTHTIEVAYVGRTIAMAVASRISTKKKRIGRRDFSDIVYAASLAHDIGNPPFGHIGEFAIQDWFKNNNTQEKPALQKVLRNKNLKNDFFYFLMVMLKVLGIWFAPHRGSIMVECV